MNASVRAVAKTAMQHGIDVFAIYQGYQGMVDGGDMIKKLSSDDVGGILHLGGTVIGTARCKEFRERSGRLKAARHLIEKGIDNLVVIGGDGSLTGADLFREEWSGLVEELLKNGDISREQAEKHPRLKIVGLVGSIDNDLSGTDMTIGADTALKRICDAVDAISSTAASHQRTFVVEVMGRNCGYLALISALATGADFVFIPEHPPMTDDWKKALAHVLAEGKKAGKRHGTVIISEGAIDKHGNPIHSADVVKALKEEMGEDARLTILGHVQRGGAPTAYDRYMSTMVGYAAVRHLIESADDDESMIIGMQENEVTPVSLMDSIAKTKSIAGHIKNLDFDKAIELRGGSFREHVDTFKTLAQAFPDPTRDGEESLNLLVLNADSPAPGMNKAVRTLVRVGIDEGHRVYGVNNAFKGLVNDDIREMKWMDVEEWTALGGSALGTNKYEPEVKDYYSIAKTLEQRKIHVLIMIGGVAGYKTIYQFIRKRDEFPAFDIPMICLPASIHNNLPGTDFSIGTDSALNNIVEAVDKIKESAVASKRAFVVEVFGRYCGFLATMSGLATGAERVYIHEEGIKLRDLQEDCDMLTKRFLAGKKLGLVIRNQFANDIYTTPFISSLFEEEGGDVFDVRQAILGHLQQGGNPSSYDRSMATLMATKCIQYINREVSLGNKDCVTIGLHGNHVVIKNMDDLPRMMDLKYFRPKDQWWLKLKEIADVLS